MELHNLRPASGATKSRKRIGRGQGSGRGGTSTRGHKGAQSRSGHKNKRNFEGGQTPMQRRLPKRGFKNVNRVEYVPINLGKLESIFRKTGSSEINLETLVELGVVRKGSLVKILGTGAITTAVNVTAHAISEKAKSTIEAQGGTVNILLSKSNTDTANTDTAATDTAATEE
jgi:large subunit ribosomal protein L15